MSRRVRSPWTLPALPFVAVFGCHPSSSSEGGSGSGSSSSSASSGSTLETSSASQPGSSDLESGSDTLDSGSDTLDSGIPGCPDVYDGHLHIHDAFDVESLRYTGQVTGNLTIKDTSFVDLEFLSCLRRVDEGRVEIVGNDGLRTLAGLEHVETLGDENDVHGGYILLFNNALLETLEHLESLTELYGLEVAGNPALTDLGLNELAFLQVLLLGKMCGTEQLNNAALVEIHGFANLTELRGFEIGQQLDLTSLGVLHDIAQRSDPPFPNGMWFWENSSLPYAEIETLLDEVGVSDTFHCGSLDDPEPVCECPTPD
jgi:hypothetical protein